MTAYAPGGRLGPSPSGYFFLFFISSFLAVLLYICLSFSLFISFFLSLLHNNDATTRNETSAMHHLRFSLVLPLSFHHRRLLRHHRVAEMRYAVRAWIVHTTCDPTFESNRPFHPLLSKKIMRCASVDYNMSAG